jgi:hypothetical protein
MPVEYHYINTHNDENEIEFRDNCIVVKWQNMHSLFFLSFQIQCKSRENYVCKEINCINKCLLPIKRLFLSFLSREVLLNCMYNQKRININSNVNVCLIHICQIYVSNIINTWLTHVLHITTLYDYLMVT